MTKVDQLKKLSNFLDLLAKGFMSTKVWNNVENPCRVHTFGYVIENTFVKCLMKQEANQTLEN